ncbi:hypothetical protein GXB85_06100 [Cellulomonas sp. APG4]|uniref:hypothetical protein n=1 Tax=Cellulomonas sp. APG4 TaxID=1538656 RepID=UPI001379FADF|nr:hypothetical protein [Cellulomonas sp. APG4]NCT90516.1 hypothetical protein [Cellulomonas sp. APG4]
MTRTLATAALTAGWLLVAYLAVTSSASRLLPSESTGPWPVGNVIAAMVVIYLPVAAAAAAVRATRTGNLWRTGLVHVGAMVGVMALLLMVLGA